MMKPERSHYVKENLSNITFNKLFSLAFCKGKFENYKVFVTYKGINIV